MAVSSRRSHGSDFVTAVRTQAISAAPPLPFCRERWKSSFSFNIKIIYSWRSENDMTLRTFNGSKMHKLVTVHVFVEMCSLPKLVKKPLSSKDLCHVVPSRLNKTNVRCLYLCPPRSPNSITNVNSPKSCSLARNELLATVVFEVGHNMSLRNDITSVVNAGSHSEENQNVIAVQFPMHFRYQSPKTIPVNPCKTNLSNYPLD